MDSKQINDLVKVDSNKYSNSDSKFEYGTFSNMNGKSGIYSIFNKITNKEYIGSTSNIGSRITKHFSELKLNKHTNHAMQDDFNEHGIDSFVYRIVEECNDNLLEKEREYQISKGIENLYNEKISDYYISDSLKTIYSNTSKESHKTKEYREYMSIIKSNQVAQYDLNGVPIKVYSRIEDVIKDNPTFKAQTIRGCCNGNKKTAYGYIWRYIDDNGNVKYKI